MVTSFGNIKVRPHVTKRGKVVKFIMVSHVSREGGNVNKDEGQVLFISPNPHVKGFFSISPFK